MAINAYILLGLEYLLGVLWLWRYMRLQRRFNKRFWWSLIIILTIIVFIRAFRFDSNLGLDMDEAMGGINAWSIGKYGVDYFNLLKHPVYLFAWGSGMNVLYPLITIPWIKLFGLNVIVYRMPMICLSVASVFLLTGALCKTYLSNKSILLIIAILFLSPWSIQANRWAIESNLFPIMMVLVIAIFILFYESKTPREKVIYLTLMTILIALSGYSYSNNWIFLGLLVVCMYTWLFFTKNVDLTHLCIQLVIMLVVVSPLLLFIYVNFISHQTIYFLGIGIPHLAATRSAFVFENGKPLFNSICHNIVDSLVMLVTGYNGVNKVAMPIWGAFYPFMFLFSVIGIIKRFGHFNYLDILAMIMLVCNIPNILFIIPSLSHFNALMFPLLYFEAIGVEEVFVTKGQLKVFVISFSLLFFFAMYSYFAKNTAEFQNGGQNTPMELGVIMKKYKNYKTVYFITDGKVNNTNSSAAFVLPIFYNQIDPYYFHQETQGVKQSEFMTYHQYGKWHILNAEDVSNRLKHSADAVYIVQKGSKQGILPKDVKLEHSYQYYSIYR
jgi:hypothetical protein